MGINDINDFNDQCNFSERNFNESMIIDDTKPRQVKAASVAKRLVVKFNAPQSFKFFYKVGYYLSEDEIWTFYEKSNNPRINSPIKYFVKSCSQRLAQVA